MLWQTNVLLQNSDYSEIVPTTVFIVLCSLIPYALTMYHNEQTVTHIRIVLEAITGPTHKY